MLILRIIDIIGLIIKRGGEMKKYFYIADVFNKVRLRPVHLTFKKARERCLKLNERYPGRYQVGDWVSDKTYKNMPYEWPWEAKLKTGGVEK